MRGLQYNGYGYYDPTDYQAIINAEKGKTMEVYRGDIFYVKKAGNITGSEQESGRPAVIVSNDIGNQHSPVVEVVYLTTQDKPPMPTHCKVICKQKSTALCEQVYTVSKDRLADYVKTCSDAEMREIDRCLMVSLGLKAEPDEFEEAAHERHGEMQARIDDLVLKLEETEKELGEKSAQVNAFKEQWKTAERRRTELSDNATNEVVILTTERDLYKRLYEEMLNRMIG